MLTKYGKWINLYGFFNELIYPKSLFIKILSEANDFKKEFCIFKKLMWTSKLRIKGSNRYFCMNILKNMETTIIFNQSRNISKKLNYDLS